MSTTQTTPSIRQIVLAHLVAGTARKVIAQVLAETHPESMAAKKSVVHIAWYAGWLKKNPAQRAKFEGVALVMPTKAAEPEAAEPEAAEPEAAEELSA